MKKITVYRSAKTGRFITAKVAKRRPATSIKQVIKIRKKKSAKK